MEELRKKMDFRRAQAKMEKVGTHVIELYHESGA